MHHIELLEQAKWLAAQDIGPGVAKQVALRRAVSALYYALFHFLIDAACREFLGGSDDNRALRNILTRAFVHGDMADISKAFHGRSLPAGMEEFGPIPPQLGAIAKTFIDLQQDRHDADYNLSASFEPQEVELSIKRTLKAMGDWEEIRPHRATRLYLVLLLTWKQIKSVKIKKS